MNRKTVKIVIVISGLLLCGLCVYILFNSAYTDWSNEIISIGLPLVAIVVVFTIFSWLFGKDKFRTVDSSKDYKVDERNVEKNIFSSMNLKVETDSKKDIEDSITVSKDIVKCSYCGHENQKGSTICEKCQNFIL